MTFDSNGDAMFDRAEAFMRKLSGRRRKMKDPSADDLSASEMLADIVLLRSMPVRLRRALRTGRSTSAIITVPTPQWIEPIAEAIMAMGDEDRPPLVIRRDAVPKDRNVQGLADSLSKGTSVVGISHIPATSLPPLLLSVAEHRFEIPRFDAETALAALRRTQLGRVPKGAEDLSYSTLDFQEVSSLLVKGGRAQDAVRRLAAVMAIKTRVGARTDSLPTLEEAIEYGEARRWALELRDDLRDLKLGTLTAKDVDRGAILFGPPGTGKTLLGRMIGEACGIPTVVGSIAEIFATSSGYLDAVVKAQRAMFQEAMNKAPSVLFLDELNQLPNIDKLSRRNADYWLPVITDFYTLLDGAMGARSGVVVIGATNRIQDINPAILRPGRLERAIFVGPPDAIGAERIMRHHLRDALGGVDISRLAAMAASERATGAVIEEVVRGARRSARRAGREMTLEDLELRVAPADRRSAGAIRRVSVHEAGHALATILLQVAEVQSVTIVAQGGSSGSMQATGDSGMLTREQTHKHAKVLLAGRAAEIVLLGDPTQGAGGDDGSDLAQATILIGSMFVSTGLVDTLVYRGGPEKLLDLVAIDPRLRERVDEVLQTLQRETIQLLDQHREDLERLASALVERRFLTGGDVRDVLTSRRVER